MNKPKARFILLLITFILQYPSLFGQEKKILDLGLNMGLNQTTLLLDSVQLQPAFLPYLGAYYNHPFNENFVLHSSLQYNIRGSNLVKPIIKRRNHFVDLSASMRYYPIDFFYASAGLNYAQLVFQRYMVLDGATGSGEQSYEAEGYQSQAGLLIGGGLQLSKVLSLDFNYMIPITSNEYKNFQIGIGISLGKSVFPKRKKKYKSLQHAFENPLEVRKLVLHRKGIKALPPEIVLFENLEELFLDGNHLVELPPEIGSLKKLTKLSLRHNKLSTLPPEIGQLNNLEEIYLEHNEIKRLPPEIGDLENLRFLYIGKNYLRDIPTQIGNLARLVVLDISYSGGLLEIPYEISQLKYLETLIIDSTVIFPTPFMLPNARLEVFCEINGRLVSIPHPVPINLNKCLQLR